MPPSDLSAARFFAALPDPRRDRTRKHALTDILVIALAATIAGAESFEAVAASASPRIGSDFMTAASADERFGRAQRALDRLASGIAQAKLDALVPRPGSPASSSVTRAPAALSRYAVAAPTSPPPMIATSVAISSPSFRPARRAGA